MVDVMQTQDPEVIKTAFQKFANVAEPWVIHDSIIISPEWYGSEAQVPGWFTSFALFSARERHSFFKSRTASTAGLPYCNQKTVDSLDFVFLVYTMGLSFWSPADSTNYAETLQTPVYSEAISFNFWEFDLYRHSSINLKTQQDVRLEANSAMIPAGFGPIGSSFGHEDNTGLVPPVIHHVGGMGIPTLKNRWSFKNPIALPRLSTIEAELEIAEYARDTLALLTGPLNTNLEPFSQGSDPTFPARCGVTVSLVGKRLVQQRGEYHV